MLSPPPPSKDCEFWEVRTAQGGDMVSSDLLAISSTATDASSDMLSCPSESADGMTPPTPYSISTTSSPSMPRDDFAVVCTEPVPSACPAPQVPSPDSTPPTKSNELWRVNPQLYATPFYNMAQSQNRISVSGMLPPGVPGGSERATASHDTGGDSPTRQPGPLPAQPMPMDVLYQHGQSSGAYFIDENGRSLPSYMSPQAIRARNLILKCDLPRRPQSIPAHVRDPVRHVSFSDKSLSPKRRKLDDDCGT